MVLECSCFDEFSWLNHKFSRLVCLLSALSNITAFIVPPSIAKNETQGFQVVSRFYRCRLEGSK